MGLGAARARMVTAGGWLRAERLVTGTAGNLSLRLGSLLLISPSGIDLGALRPEQIGLHTAGGAPVEAALAPSAELPLHLAVHAARDVGAVVHTHSPAAVAVSTLLEELPAIHYYAAELGPVRVAPYAPFGSTELAQATVAALGESTAVLLANHGAVTVGADLTDAVAAALTLEWLCEVYLRAASAGRPRVLGPDSLAEAAEALTRYRADRPD